MEQQQQQSSRLGSRLGRLYINYKFLTHSQFAAIKVQAQCPVYRPSFPDSCFLHHTVLADYRIPNRPSLPDSSSSVTRFSSGPAAPQGSLKPRTVICRRQCVSWRTLPAAAAHAPATHRIQCTFLDEAVFQRAARKAC
jgi:hypothetical protein